MFCFVAKMECVCQGCRRQTVQMHNSLLMSTITDESKLFLMFPNKPKKKENTKEPEVEDFLSFKQNSGAENYKLVSYEQHLREAASSEVDTLLNSPLCYRCTGRLAATLEEAVASKRQELSFYQDCSRAMQERFCRSADEIANSLNSEIEQVYKPCYPKMTSKHVW